jgi:hypothetical protein
MKIKNLLRGAALGVAALWLAAAVPARASLIHRYSFTTDAKDSVGTAHGVVKGAGATFDGAGNVVLPGGGSSSDPLDTIAGYVDLPNHIINVLTNLTIETWVTYNGSGSWQRIFDFGTSSAGEDVSSGNGNYLFMSPEGPTNLRFAVRDPVTGTELTQLTTGAPLTTGIETCLTVTYDFLGNTTQLYSNAVLLASGPASIPLKSIDDVNNWLGRSQWGDPMLAGSYDEFRIYDSALSPVDVAASYVSGPNQPSTDPSGLGAVSAVHLSVLKTTMTEGDTQQASASIDFAKATGVLLTGVSGVTYQSDKTNVATISATGNITAAAAGTANLSVSYSGKSDTVALTVNARQTGVAVAGTLYVDLHATDLKNGSANWPNKTGKGDFTAAGSPTYDGNVGGTGLAGVTFNGTTDAYAGPDSTPDLDGNSDRSIEVWAFNPAIASEETLVAWGHRGGPNRSNMSFNYGSNASYGAVGHWGEDIGWNGTPQAGQWHYLVYTYDGVSLAKVYADGALKSSRDYAGGISTWAALPIRIGAQCNTSGDDFDFGQALSGSIASVRVHTGQLSDNDVKNNFFFGVELTDPGALNGIALHVGTTQVIGIGSQTTANVTANYANRNYLDVTGFSTLTSSDPTVLTVNAAGQIVSVKLGSATITASYQGMQSSQKITVLSTPPPTLKHRYSFSDAAGSTTVKDSAGTSDGSLKGDLTQGGGFDGKGHLALPGGSSASGAPYVDLPNGLISSMTNATFEAWVNWGGAGAGGDTWPTHLRFWQQRPGRRSPGHGTDLPVSHAASWQRVCPLCLNDRLQRRGATHPRRKGASDHRH